MLQKTFIAPVLLAILVVAVFAPGSSAETTNSHATPVGMYLTCFSASDCTGYPETQLFINESSFGANPYTVYQFGVTGVTDSTRSGVLEGNCQSTTFSLPGFGSFNTNECARMTTNFKGSCWLSCTLRYPTEGYVSIGIGYGSKREVVGDAQGAKLASGATFKAAKKAASAETGMTVEEIKRYLENNQPYLGTRIITSYYNFKNFGNTCQVLNNFTSGHLGLPDTGSPYFAKIDQSCNPGNEITIQIYPDSTCYNPTLVTGFTVIANGTHQVDVWGPLRVGSIGKVSVNCFYADADPSGEPPVLPNPASSPSSPSSPSSAPAPGSSPSPAPGTGSSPSPGSGATPSPSSSASTLGLSIAIYFAVLLSIFL